MRRTQESRHNGYGRHWGGSAWWLKKLPGRLPLNIRITSQTVSFCKERKQIKEMANDIKKKKILSPKNEDGRRGKEKKKKKPPILLLSI